MDADDSKAALQEKLRQVEADLAELRRTAAELRQRIGERWDDPIDAADRATMITAAEEQEALAESLEARRSKLLHRLDME
jgi:hypothetical protein